MYIQCAHKNVTRDRAGEAYAIAKVRRRVEKLVAKPVGIHLTFERDAGLGTLTNCRIIAGDGQSINARFGAATLRQAVDGLVDVIDAQLRRRKARRSTGRRREAPLLEAIDEGDWDEWFYEERALH